MLMWHSYIERVVANIGFILHVIHFTIKALEIKAIEARRNLVEITES